MGLGELVRVHLELQGEQDGRNKGYAEAEEDEAPREHADKDAGKRGADGGREHDNQRANAHCLADFVRWDNLKHHGEHQRQHQAGADALNTASNQAYLERAGKTANQCANKERAEGEKGNLAGREPFHEQACEGQYQADYQHVTHNEPLGKAQVHAERLGKLGECDVERRFAVHAGKAAQVQAHHAQVRVVYLNARLGDSGVLGFCHVGATSFLTMLRSAFPGATKKRS